MMDYTLQVDRPSEQVIADLVRALQRQPLQVTISFDLQVARAGQQPCDCPHHGTEHCTCQYAVLLVHDPAQNGVSRTITVHGRDRQVWLSLLKSPTSPTEAIPAHKVLEARLLDILLSLTAISRTEAVKAGQPVIQETE
jgi:hypothetical protein